MTLENSERQQLLTQPRWRQPALPAGKSALLRGLMVSVILFLVIFPVVPQGPEMIGTTTVLMSTTTFDNPISPALSVCRTLLDVISLWLQPFLAAAILSIALLCLGCGVTACWLRQQDATRSIVIPTLLLLGLSPSITEIVRFGGPIPLCFLIGIGLIATTDQLRSEAGRGSFSCGLLAGLLIATGPLGAPALLYCLLSLACDRNVRGFSFRALISGTSGLLLGFSILVAIASVSDPTGIAGVLEGFTNDWTPHFHTDLSLLVHALTLVTSGTGIVLGILAVIGALHGMVRRPGDLALVLTMATCGPILLPIFTPPAGSPFSDSTPFLHGSIIFSQLTTTLLAAWTLTIVYRRLGKRSSQAKHWVAAAMGLLLIFSLAMRSPGLLKPRTEVVTQWSRSVLLSVPQDALLLCGGSPLGNALSVIQTQQGIRPDVIILDRSGNLDPLLLGLPPQTSPPQTLRAARALVAAKRPLVALPMALHQPLLSHHSLAPWGLLLIAHDPGTKMPDDNHAWRQIELAHLPVDPAGAWHWIRADGTSPFASGQLASEVAAGTWFAIARRQKQLRGTGRWSGILGLLGDLIEDPEALRKWAKQQSPELIGSAANPPASRISD
ncbi:MAG: hypothetical protein AAEJ04_08575 [Planctomycetota bacterium]